LRWRWVSRWAWKWLVDFLGTLRMGCGKPDFTVRYAARDDPTVNQRIGSRDSELEQLGLWAQRLGLKLQNLGRSFGQLNEDLIEEEQRWEAERVRLEEST
jgi:hypothetical protein